jgi:leader peptidase (prepilin peptidase)/N-methyltransferase
MAARFVSSRAFFWQVLYLMDAAIFALTCLLVGLLVGSFLNVVIYRLPIMMEREWSQDEMVTDNMPKFNLAVPRSACPSCGHAISVLGNIPVLSYLYLRGKCRYCRTSISARYPLIEAITGVLCAFAGWHFGFGIAAISAMLLIFALVALAAIDFDKQLLPDQITLPLLWLGLIFNLMDVHTSLFNAVLGAIIGYLSLWSVFWLFKALTGKDGMGYGDFKLFAALGAWLGWQMLPLILILSSAVGIVVAATLLVFSKRGKDIPIPFGPYLAGGGLIALFWGVYVNGFLGLYSIGQFT